MDTIEKFGNSVIQHGKNNNRIYLMKLSKKDTPSIIERLDDLALTNHYTKIFAKIPANALDYFVNNNYNKEAYIPKFFNAQEDAYFVGKYFSEERETDHAKTITQDVLKTAHAKSPVNQPLHDLSSDKNYVIRRATKEDVEDITQLYKAVFKTYPFPIHDADYIKHTMNENIVYYGVWFRGKLVALSSSEIYYQEQNAEMTDFATASDFRGKNLSLLLLYKMEAELKTEGIKLLYTIARAESYGMNITFSRSNYTYAGKLINNTNISGKIESMNVWYKPIQLH